MSSWIYEPEIRVGSLFFNRSFHEISTEFSLQAAGDLNELFQKTFGEEERFCEDGVGESWGLKTYLDELGFFKVKLEFNEHGLLETITNGESFVFLGTEIIGLPEVDLCKYFGEPEEIVRIPELDEFAMYSFSEDILISACNGFVDNVTVSSYSIPRHCVI